MMTNAVEVERRARLGGIRRFPQLIAYLRDEMGWPISQESFEDVDDLFFDFHPEELGLDPKTSAKIQEIRRLRPLSPQQPWGIFFVKFEPKRLPVVALRRILGQLAIKRRASANAPDRVVWQTGDLLFISSYGDGETRNITFAHFAQAGNSDGLPVVEVLGWNNDDTALHLDDVSERLTEKLAWPENETDVDAWRAQWRSAFSLRHREVITTSRDLAGRLAAIARAIRERITSALAIESSNGPLTCLMRAFQEALVHDLDKHGFADMYAQTIAYGLLSARISAPASKTTEHFASHMRTNPFLRELMETFIRVGKKGGANRYGIDFDELGVNEVVQLLDDANMEAIIRDFGDRNPEEDPVVHFYEHFLKEYDPQERIQRGVFYTPRSVVSFIVKSAHELLRDEFRLKDGLADTATWRDISSRNPALTVPEGVNLDEPFVQILDPATGTGTFLVEAIDLIHKQMVSRWRAEGKSQTDIAALWNDYVPKYLLPRLHGYEILMAPYAIAHLKVGLKLYETGYDFSKESRARIYLTNGLEASHEIPGQFEFSMTALAHEAIAVNEVKRAERFTVIIGNPPYSKMSANRGDDAVELVWPFRFDGEERIVDRGALALELNLQDDYVKFWGLVYRSLGASNAGIVGLITNSRYLASTSLRGLRSSFASFFDHGCIVDLGGQISERVDGTIDENVFDIAQGVAIAIFARSSDSGIEEVSYTRIFGKRSEKYTALIQGTLPGPITVPVGKSPYVFSRISDERLAEYETWDSLQDVMPFNSGAIITSRDGVAIASSKERLLHQIRMFADSPPGDQQILEELGFSVKKKWNVEACKSEIRRQRNRSKYVKQILYRPFDWRYIYYLPSLIDTPSRPVCESVFDRENLVLGTPKIKTTAQFRHALVSRFPLEKKTVSHDRATQMFPLYRYEGELLEHRRSNISDAFLYKVRSITPAATAEAVFSYIYAILNSRTYSEAYGDLLRDSFPRMPVPACSELFFSLSTHGSALIDVHLLAPGSIAIEQVPSWRGPSDIEVDGAHFVDGTIWIDKKQKCGIQGVPLEVFTMNIGGYQVCDKWLKDKRGSSLTDEDRSLYANTIAALMRTLALTQMIDQAVESFGGWPGAFVSE